MGSCAVTITGISRNPCCANQTLTLPSSSSTSNISPSILFQDVTQIVAQCSSSGTTSTTCVFQYMMVVVECKPCPGSRSGSVASTAAGIPTDLGRRADLFATRVLVDEASKNFANLAFSGLNEGSVSGNAIVFPPQFPPDFEGTCGQSVVLFASCKPVDVLFSAAPPSPVPALTCAVTFSGTSTNPCFQNQTATLPAITSLTFPIAMMQPTILFKDVTQIVAQCAGGADGSMCTFSYAYAVVECKPCATTICRTKIHKHRRHCHDERKHLSSSSSTSDSSKSRKSSSRAKR